MIFDCVFKVLKSFRNEQVLLELDCFKLLACQLFWSVFVCFDSSRYVLKGQFKEK